MCETFNHSLLERCTTWLTESLPKDTSLHMQIGLFEQAFPELSKSAARSVFAYWWHRCGGKALSQSK